MSTGRNGVMVLNDQGGGVMSVSDDITATLRAQDHGHPPLVAGFKPQQGAKAQGMGYEEEIAPTLNTSMNAGVLDTRDGN